MDLSGLVRVHVGLGSVGNNTTNCGSPQRCLRNDFFGATPNTGLLSVRHQHHRHHEPFLYWIGFTAYPAMNSTTTGSITRNTAAGNPCSPITEIYNPNVNLGGGHHDIIISGLMGASSERSAPHR